MLIKRIITLFISIFMLTKNLNINYTENNKFERIEKSYLRRLINKVRQHFKNH